MFEEYKNKIGYFIFKNRLFKKHKSLISFNNFIEDSKDYLIILPLNDPDFLNSFEVSKYFKIHKKNVTLLLPEHKTNSLNITRNYNYINYGVGDISKIGLPKRPYINKLEEYNFDVLIDLERDSNLFLAAVISIINAKFKIGFKKDEIDNLYNFQLINTKINSEISYRNLLNSLKMF